MVNRIAQRRLQSQIAVNELAEAADGVAGAQAVRGGSVLELKTVLTVVWAVGAAGVAVGAGVGVGVGSGVGSGDGVGVT